MSTCDGDVRNSFTETNLIGYVGTHINSNKNF